MAMSDHRGPEEPSAPVERGAVQRATLSVDGGARQVIPAARTRVVRDRRAGHPRWTARGIARSSGVEIAGAAGLTAAGAPGRTDSKMAREGSRG